MRRRRGWQVVAAASLLVAGGWALRVTVVDSVVVASGSMSPTICAGDRLIVLRVGAGNAGPGDLVTFRSPEDGELTLKRVVAVGGQEVQVRDGVLIVDQREVREAYVDPRTVDAMYSPRVAVEADSVFVMGDARETSVDSRDYGAVPRSSLQGQVVGRWWSGCDDSSEDSR